MGAYPSRRLMPHSPEPVETHHTAGCREKGWLPSLSLFFHFVSTEWERGREGGGARSPASQKASVCGPAPSGRPIRLKCSPAKFTYGSHITRLSCFDSCELSLQQLLWRTRKCRSASNLKARVTTAEVTEVQSK